MVKGIPEGWYLTELRDVAHKISVGLATTVTDYYAEKGVPIIRNLNIKEGYFDDSRMLFLQEEFANKFPSKFVSKDDVITVHTGAKIGLTCVVPDQYIGAHTFTTLITTTNKTALDPFYLSYYANSQYGQSEVVRLVVGGGKANLNTGDFERFRLLLPPLLEQQKIVDILRTWDKAISLTEQLIAAKQKRKQALMQQLLTGKRRFEEFYGTWRKASLGEIVAPISRRESINPDKDYQLIGVRLYVEGAHIHDVVPGSQIATKALSRIQEDDIIYNKMWATKSAFGIARKEHEGAYGSTEYPQFRAREDRLDVNFLGYMFHDPKFQYQATRLCKGTTGRARLNPGDFLEIEIHLPEIEEQRKIVAILQACDTEIDLLKQKLAAVKRQKQGLMQQLLTGRVRVKTG